MSNVLLKRTYLPAAGTDWLLPLYDPLVSLFGLDRFYYRLIEIIDWTPALTLLDVGCGTGSVGKIIKEAVPRVEFTGIDPDPKALAVAVKKLSRFSHVRLDLGYGSQLPYDDGTFHQVVSSFVFHHLPPGVKNKTLLEVRRVLRSDGAFCLVDFDSPDQAIPDLLMNAGFHTVEVERESHWLLGSVSFYSAH